MFNFYAYFLKNIGWDGLIWIGFALTTVAILFNYLLDEEYNKWGKLQKLQKKNKERRKSNSSSSEIFRFHGWNSSCYRIKEPFNEIFKSILLVNIIVNFVYKHISKLILRIKIYYRQTSWYHYVKLKFLIFFLYFSQKDVKYL